jgi:hypothetical protein
MVLQMFVVMPIAFAPLIQMANQGQAWIRLSKSFDTTSRRFVSEIISSQSDPFFLTNHHADLAPNFTWKFAGLDVTYSALAKTAASYASALFAAIILPMMSTFIKDMEAIAINATGDAMPWDTF